MSLQLNEEELQHLLQVLRNELKENTKRLRMATMQTSDEAIAMRVIQYNKTQDLLDKTKAEVEKERSRNNAVETNQAFDPALFEE